MIQANDDRKKERAMETLPQPPAVDLWKAAIEDPHRILGQATGLLRDNNIAFCVIGGQAVSSYVEPVISLDFDIVVPPDQMPDTANLLQGHFQVRRFRPFFSCSMGSSDFRIQVHSDARYDGFVERAEPRQILGLMLPVASLRDLFQSKIWAAEDPVRRASKRQKDLADIARILEVYPHLGELVPEAVKARLY
jgi:hypothetical protein